MYVKVKEYNKVGIVKEVVYDCREFILMSATPELPNQDVTEMLVMLDVDTPNEKIITVPCNQEARAENGEGVDIYLMNDNGKTVERYSY